MRKSRPTALIAALLLAAPGVALADYEDGLFPVAQGNEWIYEASDGSAGLRVRVDQETTHQGTRYFRLRDYNGDLHWVRQPFAGAVANQNRLWYRLDAQTGASWTFDVSSDSVPGSDGARLRVTTRSERVRTPAGVFSCLRVHWTRSGGDGITDEWFAPGIGLVQRRERRGGAVRDLELVRAVVGGQTVVPETTPATPTPPATPAGQGAFGIAGQVPQGRVRLRTILDQALRNPTDLAFHPTQGSLWIMDRELDGTVVLLDAGLPSMRGWIYRDDSDHFNNNPMAMAFSRTRNEFATALESRNDYNGRGVPNNFMGPTLWPGDLDAFTGASASHLDMLHHSPLAVGIAAGEPTSSRDPREYWVFNGDKGSIDRYYFREPHVPGGHDHSDGMTFRYGSGLARVPGVPGHLELDPASGILYIADTGNGRIATLDTRAYDLDDSIAINGYHAEVPLYTVPGATIRGLTAAGALEQPTGLILTGGRLVVSDHANGAVKVFSSSGALEGQVDTGLGPNAITGIAESPDGKLWLLDGARGSVHELTILP